MNIIVMGVCGTGKSSVGALLAQRLGAVLIEGDSLHSPENIAAMASGQPLTDAMRAPWLEAIADEIRRLSAVRQDAVITCSALKKAYRDILRSGDRNLIFVHLSGERATILQRMVSRPGHFMPASLLDSQLAILEAPSADERAIEVSIEQSLAAAVEEVLRYLARSAPPDSGTARQDRSADRHSPARLPRSHPTMKRLVDRLFKTLEIAIALCLVVMVVLVFGNVVLRYGFNSGIAASEELSRLMFVWLVFLGAIIALRDHAHIGVDMLVTRLPALGKKICLVLSHVLMLYGLWLLAEGSWIQTLIGLNDRAPVTGLPRAWVNAAGLVAAVAMALILLANLYLTLTGRASGKDLVMVRDNTELDEVEEIREELTRPGRNG